MVHTLCVIVQHYNKDFGKLNVALKQDIKHKIIKKNDIGWAAVKAS